MLKEIYPIDCDCEKPMMPPPPPPSGYVNWCPPPPPYPHGGWCPPPPPLYPPVCDDKCDCGCKDEVIKPPQDSAIEETPVKKSYAEQLCQLSKKSAAITNMIELFKNQNKDVVLKIGAAASYNFGTYYSKDKNVSSYGELVMTMLETELNLIKEKIAELAKLLGEEDSDGANITTFTTVTKD